MQVYEGLAGIPVVKSSISYVDGENGILEYRGIPIQELVENSNFLELSYLLIFGKIPDENELLKFELDIKENLKYFERILDIVKSLPENLHPMKILQSLVPVFAFDDIDTDIMKEENKYRQTVRIMALVPVVIAFSKRLKEGKEIVFPDKNFYYTENFLYMLNGKSVEKIYWQTLDKTLILHAEHTINASTFTAMVVVSTLADLYACVSSAIGSLSGRLHGGANEEVYKMLSSLPNDEKIIREYIENKLKNKDKIMGFGHRIYKTYDPRAKIMKYLLENLQKEKPTPILKKAEIFEKIALEYLEEKKIYTNIDFYSGVLYSQMGIPSDFFTTIFAMARVPGWIAHCIEYVRNNKLFRPTQVYDGGHNIHYKDIKSLC
ncbi:citrate/2-methylcitrate synthase [Sulfurihydrogenibium azorense]|uniref:citrate/2-methylcitrate synthase n=1 Tax=Sulfurihydrogenibium azorense TaxID=309806 RepID=UPI002409DC3F|nr:citrate/2-methylcitrate synthase [Sulfurihydrogenibium azorense]MDM7272897.1 citrate/2-methylcitrate synthase [Sulfurihydrogenibium azorense]